MLDLDTIYRDAGKPDQAVPVTSECVLPGAFITGEATASPIPASQSDERRTADGVHWRTDATGFYE